MDAVIGAISSISILGHVALLALLVSRRNRLRVPLPWNALPLILASVALAVLALANAGAARGLTLTVASIGYLAAFGVAALHDVTGRKGRLWLLVTLIWLVALLIAIFSGDPAQRGPGWLNNLFVTPSAAPLVTVTGFVLVSATLLTTLARAYLRAPLPELANRALYWVFVASAALMSVLCLTSGSPLLLLTGLLLLSAASIGSVYAQVSHRIFDIHAQIGGIVRSLVLLAIGTVITWITITLANQINPQAADAGVFVAIIALASAAVYGAVELGVRRLAQRVADRRAGDLTDAAQRTSRALTADDLPGLAAQVAGALQAEMRTNAACLLVTAHVSDSEALVVATVGATGRDDAGTLTVGSAHYRRLAVEQAPLTRYDMEYSADFRESPDSESALFDRLGMSAYAPVLADDTLIGLIAVGPKAGDTAYSVQDLRLLATLAHQTTPALRYALLAASLADQHAVVDSLMSQLHNADEQIERLEEVKTDFIAIASHELRTPLAQLSGNVELLDALHQGGVFDAAQTDEIVTNLRAASERLETLVASLLDASQIAAGGMALELGPVTLEGVVRQAVEPLAGGIRQRRIGVAVTGLRDLPTLHADSERLTLALRYLLLNAIKYTPDNGRVDVTARHEAALRPGGESALVLSVKDNGVGIDGANLALIFRKFYRAGDVSTHSSSDMKFMSAGPGLGLPIVKGIVEAHGGRVWAESPGYDPERFPGTTVFVRLPLTPVGVRVIIPDIDMNNETTNL